MNFESLMSVIGIKLTPFEVAEGVTVYIKLPSIRDNADCADPFKAIFHCVVDENGKQIFDSAEQVECNVDLTVQLKLNHEIGRVFEEAFKPEDVEAK